MKNEETRINDRAEHLLKRLIELYIRDGAPVGSATLASDLSLGISSATVRNVLADLEERGFLRSPHTSAGRVPTNLAYRYFVNSILTSRRWDESETVTESLYTLPQTQDRQTLLASASNLLSEVTKMVGMVTVARPESLLHQIEFLPLSGRQILVVLVFQNHEIQNRMIETERVFSRSELIQLGNYLSANFQGKMLSQIRENVYENMQNLRDEMNGLIQSAMGMVDQALSTAPSESCLISGQTHIFDLAERANIDKLREIFVLFNEKRQVLHLLDRCLNSEGVQIFIGEESGHAVFDDCSIIVAPYTAQNRIIGVLGVVGPTRMPYEHVIQVVDVTAKLLSSALNEE